MTVYVKPSRLLEVARVHLEITPVVLRRHRPRPLVPLPARRAADVLDGRRPGGVVLVVVLRPERLEHEQRGLEAARDGELLGKRKHSADASNAARHETDRNIHSSPSGTTPRLKLATCSGVKGGRESSSLRWNAQNMCTM